MSDLIRIPPEWLKDNAQGTRDDIHLYWKGFFLARYWMWKRLEILARMMSRVASEGSALDVGGGAGVLLPTLSRRFKTVTLLDLDPSVAEKVKAHYKLSNVTIVRGDILKTDLPANSFDFISATAFLEHFTDAALPIACIHRWLKPGGILVVDQATENWIYRLGRAVGGIEKPKDHYHDAEQIRNLLLKKFSPTQEHYVPRRPFALYYQAALRKN